MASVEYKYVPVVGTLDTDNTLEMDEISNSRSTSDGDEKMTVQKDISESAGSRTFLYIAACIVNLAALTCGITLGWTSPELPKLADNATTPLPTPVTVVQGSWIGSLLPLGAAFSPFAAGIAADKLGRKNTLLIGIIPFIIAFICATFAHNVILFYLLRFLCGLGVGTTFTVLPMYIGEIADDSIRGALGSMLQLFVTIGLLYSYAIGPYLSVFMFNIVCLIPPISFLVLYFIFIPDSPYYLLINNKGDESERVLSKLRGNSNVKSEMENMKQAVEEANDNKGSFVDLYKNKVYRKALMLSVGLMVFQQFCGINVVLFYTYQVTGNSLRPDIATILVGIMQVVFSCTSPIFVEKRGKRFLLLFSSIGMTISLAGLGLYFRLKDVGSSHADTIFWLPILCLVIYNAAYCAGFGPLPWAILGELFPANVKSSASTLTAAVCWLLGFLITKYFSIVAVAVGNGIAFWIFAASCVVATLFVYKLVPETSGKSLQEIQEILGGNNTNTNTNQEKQTT